MQHKYQNKAQQPASSPSIFNISIFSCAQQFLALYLLIQSGNANSCVLSYFSSLLHRTKSPPIALTYTKQFISPSSQSQIQLSIIRFVSQLSDLSIGKSVQSSLSFLENGSFLTQLRHNLTHRLMAKGIVVQRAKEMIIHQLKNNYWLIMFHKIWQTYYIDDLKVKQFYHHIKNYTQNGQRNQQQVEFAQIQSCKLYKQYLQQLKDQQTNKMTKRYIFSSTISAYQQKSLIKPYLQKVVLPLIRSPQSLLQPVEQLSQQFLLQHFELETVSLKTVSSKQNFINRQVILFCQLLDLVHELKSKTRLLAIALVLAFIQIYKTDDAYKPILQSRIVNKKLRKFYFFKYLKEYQKVVEALPQYIKEQFQTFQNQKKRIHQQKNPQQR